MITDYLLTVFWVQVGAVTKRDFDVPSQTVSPVSAPGQCSGQHGPSLYLRKYMRSAGLPEEMIAAILSPDFFRTAHCASESELDNTSSHLLILSLFSSYSRGTLHRPGQTFSYRAEYEVQCSTYLRPLPFSLLGGRRGRPQGTLQGTSTHRAPHKGPPRYFPVATIHCIPTIPPSFVLLLHPV